jgi:hypothetical protein
MCAVVLGAQGHAVRGHEARAGDWDADAPLRHSPIGARHGHGATSTVDITILKRIETRT